MFPKLCSQVTIHLQPLCICCIKSSAKATVKSIIKSREMYSSQLFQLTMPAHSLLSEFSLRTICNDLRIHANYTRPLKSQSSYMQHGE